MTKWWAVQTRINTNHHLTSILQAITNPYHSQSRTCDTGFPMGVIHYTLVLIWN